MIEKRPMEKRGQEVDEDIARCVRKKRKKGIVGSEKPTVGETTQKRKNPLGRRKTISWEE